MCACWSDFVSINLERQTNGISSFSIGSFLEKLKILLETSNNLSDYKKLSVDINNFREYANESFIKVSNVFNSTTCPGIDKDWFQISNYKEYLKKKITLDLQ